MKIGILLIGGVVSIGGTILAYGGHAGGTEMCGECAARMTFTEWYGWTTSEKVEPTLLSAQLDPGVIPTHAHRWLFAAGTPAGGGCAIGQGQNLWRVAFDADVAAFFADVARYGKPGEADHCRRLALNPRESMDFWGAVSMAQRPAAGFADAAAFDEWWSAHKPEFDEELAR